MLRVVAFALLGLALFSPAPASARIECAPHCDYNHDYGPYDFTYIRPGLYGYPRCNARGECLPYLGYVYSYPRYSITIRTRPFRSRR
jgi:hypothetical protein